MSEKWDRRYVELARMVSTWSKDPSTQVGAVLVRPDNSVASVGYNGFAKGIEDLAERLENREIKNSFVIHAEMNAVLNAHDDVRGDTLYLWPLLCCDRCAVHMIQAGVRRIVSPSCPPDKMDRWEPILAESRRRFEEAGVAWMEIPYEQFSDLD